MGSEVSSRAQFLRLAAGAAGAPLLASLAMIQPNEAAASSAQTIMLIRHGEKPNGGAPYGVTAEGIKSKESLIVQGWTRAGALVELFAPAAVPIREGLTRPNSIFASRPHHADSSLRPIQTVTPLAARLALSLNTSFVRGDEKALARQLLATPGASLVAWQHQDIPAIAQRLGFAKLGVPTHWPGNRFDIVWVFTRSSNGKWSFRQVPQLLLAGDSPTVFKS